MRNTIIRLLIDFTEHARLERIAFGVKKKISRGISSRRVVAGIAYMDFDRDIGSLIFGKYITVKTNKKETDENYV